MPFGSKSSARQVQHIRFLEVTENKALSEVTREPEKRSGGLLRGRGAAVEDREEMLHRTPHDDHKRVINGTLRGYEAGARVLLAGR